MEIYFDICPELIVRTDWGCSSNPDYKNIASTECKALTEGRSCLYSGKCIYARTIDGEKITRKTFKQ